MNLKDYTPLKNGLQFIYGGIHTTQQLQCCMYAALGVLIIMVNTSTQNYLHQTLVLIMW